MRNKKLIAMLIVLGVLIVFTVAVNVIFMVRTVKAYNYLDDTDTVYDTRVIEASGIKKNSSILLMNEKKIAAKIEKELYNIEVKNIERKFPSIVSVNYIVHKPLFEFYADGFYFPCYSNGKAYEKREQSAELFLLKFNSAASVDAGSYFSSDDLLVSRVETFVDTWYRVLGDRQDEELSDKFLFVDMTKENRVYIRMKTGCGIDIAYTEENMAQKFANAYAAYLRSGAQANSGTYIYTTPENAESGSYSDRGVEEYYSAHYGG